MLQITFTTQLLSSASQYQVIDLSTDRSGYEKKFIIIYGQDGNTVLNSMFDIPINTDTVTFSTTGWGLLNGLLQIFIDVGYIQGGSPSTVRKTWLLPTTLNLPA